MNSSFINEVIAAIESREIKAYYQPQYDANTGRLVSAEALVRWEKANGEIVSPDSFIPELEKTEAINLLDWFMAEEVCRTIHELGEAAVPIAVNFSRWHIRERDFSRKLNSLLSTYGIQPRMFEVEITESAMAAVEFSIIQEWAYNVADIGVSIAIDDFGAGFTSLQFVKDLPVNFLKIDKAFLADNCQDDRGRGTLETVFFFANKLNLSTIAEGVETIEQLKFMQNMDCDRVQGYLFSKPLKKEDFLVIALMDTQPTVDDDNFLKKQGTFSTHSLLLKAIRDEYDMIIFGNLYKNSYYLMHQRDGVKFKAATAGVIDDMSEATIAMSADYDSGKKYRDTLSRPALIKAFNEGKTRVECEVNIKTEHGVHEFITVVHLMKHPYRDDILMIGMSRTVKNPVDTNPA
jgi:EAL domain-containing protein (putative c-di-GMP-specific phosphodiesterase class I)